MFLYVTPWVIPHIATYRNPRLTVTSIKGRTFLIFTLFSPVIAFYLPFSLSLISPSWPHLLLIFGVFLIGGPSSTQSPHHLALVRCLLRWDGDFFHIGQKAKRFLIFFLVNRLRKVQPKKAQGIIKSSPLTFDFRILFSSFFFCRHCSYIGL